MNRKEINHLKDFRNYYYWYDKDGKFMKSLKKEAEDPFYFIIFIIVIFSIGLVLGFYLNDNIKKERYYQEGFDTCKKNISDNLSLFTFDENSRTAVFYNKDWYPTGWKNKNIKIEIIAVGK